MARGHQKIQAQQKAQKKADQAKKGQGCDQKTAAQKALHHKCTVCMVRFLVFVSAGLCDAFIASYVYRFHNDLFQAQMPDPKTYKQHFESKHPKATLPTELIDVQA
ncbi:unnamed protein product [Heligmosomoides polygyrus]|uniref:4F5 domain-containing protein n=1 Tax=Heligmosomoides polygyrus TaxID=6339 RepID=A0A183GDW6_HELPZ|nr:unnamed protein product [Heligmosomoides polygyrus]